MPLALNVLENDQTVWSSPQRGAYLEWDINQRGNRRLDNIGEPVPGQPERRRLPIGTCTESKFEGTAMAIFADNNFDVALDHVMEHANNEFDAALYDLFELHESGGELYYRKSVVGNRVLVTSFGWIPSGVQNLIKENYYKKRRKTLPASWFAICIV